MCVRAFLKFQVKFLDDVIGVVVVIAVVVVVVTVQVFSGYNNNK